MTIKTSEHIIVTNKSNIPKTRIKHVRKDDYMLQRYEKIKKVKSSEDRMHTKKRKRTTQTKRRKLNVELNQLVKSGAYKDLEEFELND